MHSRWMLVGLVTALMTAACSSPDDDGNGGGTDGGGGGNVEGNRPPTVSVGDTVHVTLPQNSVTLTATASDPDGDELTFSWSQTSETDAAIATPDSASTVVSGLSEGSYELEVSVDDAHGHTVTSAVEIVVSPPLVTVDAGADVTIALPTRTVDLHGAASASDGNPPSLSWELVDGTDATLAGTTTETLTASGLVPGAYTFRLTATDDAGDEASDEVVVTVTTSGKTYYVAEGGSDATGDGSEANPWASLHNACAKVLGPGDTIHVVAGEYVESAQCVLAPEVSIEGEGEATHIELHDEGVNAYGGSIQLKSTTGGTDGSQSISDLWLDGADIAHRAILVHGRSHVLVRHVTFTNFLSSALVMIPVGTWAAAPAIYETGNELSSSTITDCSDRTASGGGVIGMGGQEGSVIRDNTFTQTGRDLGHNGNVMGAVYGHNKGWSYYRNVSEKPVYDGPQDPNNTYGWNFGLEVWNNEGGTEIWGNTFTGGGNAVDIGGANDIKGAYDYSWYIHDNVFKLDAQLQTSPTDTLVPMAVQFEVPATDAIVSNNHFLRLAHGVQLLLTHNGNIAIERIAIHNNYFEEMGFIQDTIAGTMVNIWLGSAQLIGSIDIDNNTMLSGTAGHARAALFLNNNSPTGIVGPINFRNNIVEHVATYGYITFNGNSTIADVTSSNNLLFDNVNDNAAATHATTSLTPPTPTVTNFVEVDNQMVDPQLDPNGHPLPGSPAFGNGIDVGYGDTIGAFP